MDADSFKPSNLLIYCRRFMKVQCSKCHQVQVSWEQKGKSEKVPVYEAEVCFGTAGLEAHEETLFAVRFRSQPLSLSIMDI